MFKHIALIAVAMFISVAAFAGKPYSVLVFDDLSRPVSSDQQDNRTASLLIEYLKSELATHSQITLCDAEAVEKAMKDFRIKHKQGTSFSDEEVKEVLAAAKGDYLALLSIVPEKNDDAKNVNVTVYDKEGNARSSSWTRPPRTAPARLPRTRNALTPAPARSSSARKPRRRLTRT